MSDLADCPGCRRSASMALAPGEVDRLLAGYLADHPGAIVADDATYERRLDVCAGCPELRYAGTTCRHCGCLVAVRAKLAEKRCPATPQRW